MSGTTHFEESSNYSYSLQLTHQLLNDLIDEVVALGDFQPAREFHYNQELSQIATDISTFVEITTLLTRIAKSAKRTTLSEFKDSHIQLLFVLKAINQMQLKRDYVALEDLIKYELKDILTQWKINLLPQLKRHFSP